MKEAYKQAVEIYNSIRKQDLSLMHQKKAQKARRALKFMEPKKETS